MSATKYFAAIHFAGLLIACFLFTIIFLLQVDSGVPCAVSPFVEKSEDSWPDVFTLPHDPKEAVNVFVRRLRPSFISAHQIAPPSSKAIINQTNVWHLFQWYMFRGAMVISLNETLIRFELLSDGKKRSMEYESD